MILWWIIKWGLSSLASQIKKEMGFLSYFMWEILPISGTESRRNDFWAKLLFWAIMQGAQVMWRSILSATFLLQIQKLNSLFELLAQLSIKVREVGCPPVRRWQLCEDSDDMLQVCHKSTTKTSVTLKLPGNDPLAQGLTWIKAERPGPRSVWPSEESLMDFIFIALKKLFYTLNLGIASRNG